ncbi:Heat shock 70 kDa protein 12A [Mactra antiquata]
MALNVGTDKKAKLLVAAIDFGTTYSGYAFSFKHEYQADPAKVSVNGTWFAGSMALVSMKAPTVVLFNEKKEFQSFGYEAENEYSELALDHEHEKYYFFKRFKMYLHDKKIVRQLEVQDDRGRKLPGMKVFAAVINFLMNHLLTALKKRGTLVDIKDIHWVLTVPAIWVDSAKQFMRESAGEAKIDGKNLSISLEPEAASLYCQLIPTDKINGSEGCQFQVASPGSKYMVIDLGGGTADITVHERQADGGLRELHKATGGAWGGTKVDEEFYQLIIKIIGAPAFQKFCRDHTSDYLDLQRELEVKKRIITPKTKGKVTLKVPVSLGETYKTEMEESVEDALKESPLNGKISWLPDKLRIDAEVFKGLFKMCSEKIVEHILSLLKFPEIKDTKNFLMVGGFSESEMMQDAIMKALPNRNVIIPDEAGLTVLKGAVIFGHRPVAITSRCSRYTYGINISPPFDPALHSADRKVNVGNMERCRDVFKKYIQEGDVVQVGEPRSGKHITLAPHQREMQLNIYASPKREPTYVDEDDSEYLGRVIVELPDSDERIRVEVTMVFGETELTVQAQELTTLKKFSSFFDFL